MAHKQVPFRAAAREKILCGAAALADAVRITLGPKSKSVLIQRSWGRPLVCNDGVTIAKEFDLKDPEENLVAQMIRQTAERTGESVGDRTSTSRHCAVGRAPGGKHEREGAGGHHRREKPEASMTPGME